jgi:sulfide:quinone oxidoreductase
MPARARHGGFRVLIAGGGVAALEGALALRASAMNALELTLLCPQPDFVYRPLAVREPFAYGVADRHPIASIASDLDAELVVDSLGWVAPERSLAHTGGGARLPYDALLLGVGATAQARYSHALTIDDRHLDAVLHGLIQDVEGGYVRSVAFLIPPRVGWPLPVYELALMTAGRAFDMDVELAVMIVTPEEHPLGIFGQDASEGVADLLRRSRVQTITSAYAEVPKVGKIVLHPGGRLLSCDRVVALPELFGPAIRGLPAAEHGFIPIDRNCRVRGTPASNIFAAGDATEFPVKHGGLAAQQADAAAEAIAALAGAAIEPTGFDPVIHGMLLTGGPAKYLTARITGGHGFASTISDSPTWTVPGKIAARYLAPYLDERASSRRAKVA